MACAARFEGVSELRPPPNFPMGVRTAERTKTSVMSASGHLVEHALKFSGIGRRRLAGEILTEIRRGPTVDWNLPCNEGRELLQNSIAFDRVLQHGEIRTIAGSNYFQESAGAFRIR